MKTESLTIETKHGEQELLLELDDDGKVRCVSMADEAEDKPNVLGYDNEGHPIIEGYDFFKNGVGSGYRLTGSEPIAYKPEENPSEIDTNATSAAAELKKVAEENGFEVIKNSPGDSGDQSCTECQGSGKCKTCHGKGWDYVDLKPTKCPKCKGTGVCPKCRNTAVDVAEEKEIENGEVQNMNAVKSLANAIGGRFFTRGKSQIVKTKRGPFSSLFSRDVTHLDKGGEGKETKKVEKSESKDTFKNLL